MAEVGTAAKRPPEPSSSPRNRPRQTVDLPYTLHPPNAFANRGENGSLVNCAAPSAFRKLNGTFRRWAVVATVASRLAKDMQQIG